MEEWQVFTRKADINDECHLCTDSLKSVNNLAKSLTLDDESTYPNRQAHLQN